MKSRLIFKWNSIFILFMVSGLVLVTSCKKDDDGTDPTGSKPTAAFDAGTIDGLTVSFVNASFSATSYEWDFGDGSAGSTESDPTHTFPGDGTYTVTLTAINADGSDEVSKDITVMEPVYKNFIVGREWIAIREDAIAYHLGPNDGSWTYDAQTNAPWFNIGDIQDGNGDFICQSSLDNRPSMANDVYTFNEDGTYNINWNGDFWGEFGIWAGTPYNEVDIEIVGGALPATADGTDVSAFVKETQNYVIDEVNATLQVIGEGAHIHNPRYKDGESSYDVGNGITYNIYKIAEGVDADTLVLYNTVFDNDFQVENMHFFTYATYKGQVPDIRENAGFVPTDYADEISSEDISHMFDMETNYGSGVDEVTSSSVLEYGVMQDGVTCTKYTRTDADGGFTDFKLWSRDADIRFDDCDNYTFSKAVVDVYIPSSNDFSGSLANQVMVKLADESGDDDGGEGGPGFWCCWTTLAQTDIALDTWTTLTFDFTNQLDDAEAACGIRDDIDLVILEFGGSGHGESGEIFYSNFRFEQ